MLVEIRTDLLFLLCVLERVTKVNIRTKLYCETDRQTENWFQTFNKKN